MASNIPSVCSWNNVHNHNKEDRTVQCHAGIVLLVLFCCGFAREPWKGKSSYNYTKMKCRFHTAKKFCLCGRGTLTIFDISIYKKYSVTRTAYLYILLVCAATWSSESFGSYIPLNQLLPVAFYNLVRPHKWSLFCIIQQPWTKHMCMCIYTNPLAICRFICAYYSNICYLHTPIPICLSINAYFCVVYNT